ncbi:MSF1-domain-containing protein [Russula aff. rugulosa BPL654]|nr:MSF1-domain-containing protein [Russula aff. rugulosa BPL654]
MRFFSQSFLYDDPWPIVSLAFFLRYPNPYASHVISCDVISREFTPSGSLMTTRLILKTATLPRWAPKGIISRSESWILEESEVDPQGKVVRCLTRNLEHVKAMQVHESQTFSQVEEGKTLQTTEARIVSGFGWGLTRQIENYGLARFRKNVQRSREGVTLIVDLIRQARRQPMPVGSSYLSATSASRFATTHRSFDHHGPESHQFPGSDNFPHRG